MRVNLEMCVFSKPATSLLAAIKPQRLNHDSTAKATLEIEQIGGVLGLPG